MTLIFFFTKLFLRTINSTYSVDNVKIEIVKKY